MTNYISLQFKHDIRAFQYFNSIDCGIQLAYLRWPSGKPVCELCGVESALQVAKTEWLKCNRHDPPHCFLVRDGTLFGESLVPLPKWFFAVYHISTAKRRHEINDLADIIDTTQHTAQHLTHAIDATIAKPAFAKTHRCRARKQPSYQKITLNNWAMYDIMMRRLLAVPIGAKPAKPRQTRA